MKVFELANKLRRSSKEILQAANYLEILVKTKSSILSDEEVKQIIKYFRKKRVLFFFKRYSSLFLLIILLTMLFFIITPQNTTSGEIYASVDEKGEVSVEWKFEDSVEEGAIVMDSESLIVFIEVDENNGETVECCFEEDLKILLLITDDDELIEVKSLDLSLSNTSISTSTTTTSILPQTSTTSTTTTLPKCNDEDFKPYTLYDSDGNANTVMSCRNEQDALASGFEFTVNPKPPPSTTTTTSTITTTSTTTTTIPDPSSSISQSLSSCSGPSGTRTSTLSLTNNESYTAYYLIEYSTNSGSSYSTAQTNQSISGGATNTANSVVVSDGSSIIWRFKDSRTSNDFSNASYEILSVVTVDCPDGYYVNVDGSTYALGLECRNWNNNTKARFRANPWWMNDNGDTAVDYMNALIALTGDYDDGDTDVEMTDYFDYSSSFPGNCSGLSQGLSFVFKRDSGSFHSPEWNSSIYNESWNSSNRAYVIFAELVP